MNWQALNWFVWLASRNNFSEKRPRLAPLGTWSSLPTSAWTIRSLSSGTDLVSHRFNPESRAGVASAEAKVKAATATRSPTFRRKESRLREEEEWPRPDCVIFCQNWISTDGGWLYSAKLQWSLVVCSSRFQLLKWDLKTVLKRRKQRKRGRECPNLNTNKL